MTVASAGMARFAPTDSIKPPRTITTPFGMAAPLTGCTVPPVMAKTPGASAHSGSASRNRTTKQTDRLDILTSAARDHNLSGPRGGEVREAEAVEETRAARWHATRRSR